MGKKVFEEYLKQQDENSTYYNEIDRGEEKQHWLHSLSRLYQTIEGFVKEYKQSGKVSIEYRKKTINEEWIGEYEVNKAIIKFKGQEVVVDPVGTNIIGAKGRVDMKGNQGLARFVLVDENETKPMENIKIRILDEAETKEEEQEVRTISWKWKIATPPPQIEYIELTEDSFFDALMEIIHG